MLRRILTTMLVVLLAGLLAGTVAPPASAHEGRRVGNFEFTVGWGTEPAYAGAPNSVSLDIHEAHAAGDEHAGGTEDHAVTDLKDTLKVEVSFGTQKQTYTLEPAFVVGVFGEPGNYRAYLVPTRPGTYSFLFTGTIRGQRVNARFTSSEKTFDDIHNTAEAQFPVKDPSTGDLATRLDREIPRLGTALAAATKKANDDAGKAMMFGYAGLGLAAIATVIALTRGRRKGV